MNVTRDMGIIPKEMFGRPIDDRGFLVPWFVTGKTPDGRWDFRHVDPMRIREAVKHRKCFVSGEKMGKFAAFVVGPMCTINRIAADAPVKPNVAEWSAQVCPFLSRPLAKRPEDENDNFARVPGVMVAGNPGVCAVWVTKEYQLMRNGLFNIGEPERVTWYTKGRVATTEEAREGFDRGAARLMAMAEAEAEDEDAVKQCRNMTSIAREFLP